MSIQFKNIQAGTKNTIIADENYHILVLVAGTTDPFNMDYTVATRAHSFYSDNVGETSFYWGKGSKYVDLNKHFRENINKLTGGSSGKNAEFILFCHHGWSGDNNIDSRKAAGKFLVDRLCTEVNGQKSYYEGLKKGLKTVYFHLLGHSHGGNVINEMTQRIGEQYGKGNWPKNWQIASIVYLSTPFFNTLHQIKITDDIFHPKFKVLNVHCEYDLTQRVIADFSLYQLAPVTFKISQEQCRMLNLLKPLIFKETYEKLINSSSCRDSDTRQTCTLQFEDSSINTLLHDMEVKKQHPIDRMLITLQNAWKNSDWQTSKTDFLIRPYDAQEFLIVFNLMMNAFERFLMYLMDLIEYWNSEEEFELTEESKKITKLYNYKIEPRKVLDDKTADQMKFLIDDLIELTTNVADKLYTKDIKTFYVIETIDTVLDLFPPILDILEIDGKTLKHTNANGLFNLIYNMFKPQMEKYDNTYHEPDKQFANSKYINEIQKLDVTTRDAYDIEAKKSGRAFLLMNHRNFVKKIMQVEKRYQSDQSKKNWLDMLFTLVSHVELVRVGVALLVKYKDLINGIKIVLNYIKNSTLITALALVAGKRGIINKAFVILNRAESMLDQYRDILSTRCGGQIEDTQQVLKTTFDKSLNKEVPIEMRRGSLAYLMVESHSVSRRRLHDEVKDFLLKQKKNVKTKPKVTK